MPRQSPGWRVLAWKGKAMQTTKTRRIVDVKKDMVNLLLELQKDKDYEVAHYKADTLLVELCRLLLEKPTITQERRRVLVSQILEAYEASTRYYA